MAASQANIELVTLPSGVQPPSCLHGPTLLFERFDQANKRVRKFFACSAFRDKKECIFHKWYDEWTTKPTPTRLKATGTSHKQLRNRFRKFKKVPRPERSICCTCGLLLLNGEMEHHKVKGHAIKLKVKLQELRRPSFLFKPLDNNKTYAQYLFSVKAVNYLLDTVEKLHFTHVLCVGAPRIHEEIQARRRMETSALSSMLLDLDERYAQFYPPALFAKYNMFNHHFFTRSGEKRVCEFLHNSSSAKTILITDPPFGGMVEALAQSFMKLSNLWSQGRQGQEESESSKETIIPLMWIFPYFMEARITSSLSSLNMLDYKVDYDNHNLFNNKHHKKGSPVRIFTNISPALVCLPKEQGYWFCELCQRYSAPENQHCRDCGTCPSKDGTTYVHCDACMRCVKPSRIHCYKCQMCTLQDHQCGKLLAAGCHICGEMGHKRRDCPQKGHSKPSKRKLHIPAEQTGKRRKTIQ